MDNSKIMISKDQY